MATPRATTSYTTPGDTAWRTPFQAICDAWAKDPSILEMDPRHLIPGPNS